MDNEELLLDMSELPIYQRSDCCGEGGIKSPLPFAEENTPAKNTPATTGEGKSNLKMCGWRCGIILFLAVLPPLNRLLNFCLCQIFCVESRRCLDQYQPISSETRRKEGIFRLKISIFFCHSYKYIYISLKIPLILFAFLGIVWPAPDRKRPEYAKSPPPLH